jgi:hypothetical protein
MITRVELTPWDGLIYSQNYPFRGDGGVKKGILSHLFVLPDRAKKYKGTGQWDDKYYEPSPLMD